MSENKERQNPFFIPYGTPHDVAPFDKIRLEDYREAFLEGIRREDEQIEKAQEEMFRAKDKYQATQDKVKRLLEKLQSPFGRD